MEDPKIIDSPLCRIVEQDDVSVEICIYRLEETEWTLEVVAENGTSTVWEDQFSSDEVALAEALTLSNKMVSRASPARLTKQERSTRAHDRSSVLTVVDSSHAVQLNIKKTVCRLVPLRRLAAAWRKLGFHHHPNVGF